MAGRVSEVGVRLGYSFSYQSVDLQATESFSVVIYDR